MNQPRLRRVLFFIGLLLATHSASAASEPFTLLYSLFDPATNAQAGPQQGYSVAIEGDIAVVGAPYDDSGIYDSGVVRIYIASTGALLHTLTNPAALQQDLFGSTVAISGKRVVVGGPSAEPSYSRRGVAYVYDLSSATPTVPVLTLAHPNPTTADRFGSAVAISGTSLVIGSFGDDTGAANTGKAFVYNLASAAPAVPMLTLTNPTPVAGDGFGRAVAISGNSVVVGVYGDNSVYEDVGSAYIYDLSGSAPAVPVLRLLNPTPGPFDQFGLAVGIAGTRVVIGARYDSTAGNRSGSAYVFDLSSPTPGVPVETLTNPDPAENENFGFAVGISGDRVVVGALGDGTGAPAAGSAYVYDLASAAPTVPVLTLTNPAPGAADYLGFSVAISGTKLVVGAINDDTMANDAGSAYVYDLTSATPVTPTAVLNSPGPNTGDSFGNSTAVDGRLLVVGASRDDTGATDAGIVYVYDLANFSPVAPILTLTNPSPSSGDAFGYSVSIDDDIVAVGAPEDDTGATNAGSVYIYNLTSVTPALPTLTLTNPSPATGDRFGASVSTFLRRVAVGAPGDNTGATDAGSAYVYELFSAAPIEWVTTLTNPTPSLGDTFGGAVALSRSRIIVGARYDDTGGTDTGSAYVYDPNGVTPEVPVITLTNPNPANFRYFGHSVATFGVRAVIGANGSDSAYVFNLSTNTPTIPMLILENPNPGTGNNFGDSVAISFARACVGAPFTGFGVTGIGRAYLYDMTSPTPTAPLATLSSPTGARSDEFGRSVAISGATVIAGVPGDDTTAPDRGAAYVFAVGPLLKIVPAAPRLATLSWTPDTGFPVVLQYTDSFAPTNWLTAPSGVQNPVTVSSTNATRFYRLVQP